MSKESKNTQTPWEDNSPSTVGSQTCDPDALAAACTILKQRIDDVFDVATSEVDGYLDHYTFEVVGNKRHASTNHTKHAKKPKLSGEGNVGAMKQDGIDEEKKAGGDATKKTFKQNPEDSNKKTMKKESDKPQMPEGSNAGSYKTLTAIKPNVNVTTHSTQPQDNYGSSSDDEEDHRYVLWRPLPF